MSNSSNLKYYNRNLAFVDCETTGLKIDRHEIIEIAAIVYDRKQDKVLEEYEDKVAPRRIHTAQAKALEINGYTNNHGLYTGNIQSTLIKFNNIVKDCIIVGQNIFFDLQFIESAMAEFNFTPAWDLTKRIDLMAMAWPYVQDIDLPGLGLRNFCDHFNLSNEGQHTALVDCRRSLSVYRCLMDKYKNGIKR